MRKGILTLMILFCAVFVHAQLFIGFSESEIRARVKPTEQIKTHVMPDGVRSLSLEYKEGAAYTRRYYMDKKTGRCYLYVLQPKSQEALDQFIKFCDENYDETEKENLWMTNVCLSYANGRCADDVNVRVELRTVKATGKKMFYFIPVEEPSSSSSVSY